MEPGIPGGLQLLGVGKAFQEELCDTLADTALFNDLAWPEIKALGAFMQGYQAPAGTTIFKEGEVGQYMCVILSGSVPIEKEDRQMEHKTVAEVGAGKSIGDRLAAQIGVRADDFVANRGQRRACVEIRERMPRREKLIEPRQQVVAGNHADSPASQVCRVEDGPGFRGAGGRVHAAGIRHDL